MVKDIRAANESVRANTRTVETLRREFPQCFTNAGAFDLEKFKALLGADGAATTIEGYDLNFLGKQYARLVASTDTTTVLVPDAENNAKPENKDSGNVYISGDNLDALKHLLKSYRGAVKCIYIDPPYNTGSDGFVYNDTFNWTADALAEKLGVDTERAERILKFMAHGSASHSAWLTFMAPRLSLARDLLTDDGVIFISIDDNEQANLKLLCDSIFGEENFISDSIWHSKYTTSNDSKDISRQHEHILIYCKEKDCAVIGLLNRTAEMDAAYKNPDNDPKGAWKPTPLHAKSGTESSLYTIEFPNGQTWRAPDGRYPRYSKDRLMEIYNENGLYFNSHGGVDKKTYLSEVKQGKTVGSIWSYEEVGSSHQANEQLADLLGKGVFDNPKPIGLLERCLFVAGLNVSDQEIVVDFFSGSASTAHAVLDFNCSQNKSHKFIMVQIAAAIDKNRAKYKTIDEIGQERIRRAAAKIKAEMESDLEKRARVAEMDFGFRHYTLKEPDDNTLDRLEAFDPNGLVSDMTVLDEFGRDTVLATWLNADGYGLTARAEAVELENYTAWRCGRHLYFLDPGLTDGDVVKLVERYGTDAAFNAVNWVVFGYSFSFTELEMLKKNAPPLEDGRKNLRVRVEVRY